MWIPVLIALVACVITLQNYLELGTYEKTLMTNQHNISSLEKIVDDAAESVVASVDTLINSPGVYEYLYEENGQNAELLQKISQTLFQTVLNNRYISSIGIVKDPDNAIVRNPYSFSVKDEDIQYFYRAASSLWGARFLDIFTGDNGYLTVYVAPIAISADRYACLFAVFNQDMMAKSMTRFNSGVSRYYMFGTAGKLLFGSDNELPANIDKLLFMDTDESGLIRYEGKYYLRESLLSIHWILLMEAAQIAPYRNLERVVRLVMWVCVAMGAVTMLEYAMISSRYNARIRELNEFTQRIIDGDMDTRFHGKYSDEISKLGNSLNVMVDTMAIQIEKITRQNYAIQNAQFFALQNQMNPHFINNVLESIRMVAMTNGDTPVAEMVVQLAHLIRYSLKKSDGYATVSEEITNVNAYLRLQKIKYRERLQIAIEISPDISDEIILRFLLQPIVENAIYHGIEPKRGVSRLTIRGDRTAEGVRFTISDDGVGMTEEKLAEIREQVARRELSEENYKLSTTGIGLSNVSERLYILFGENSRICVSSSPGAGTSIEVTIPKEAI